VNTDQNCGEVGSVVVAVAKEVKKHTSLLSDKRKVPKGKGKIRIQPKWEDSYVIKGPIGVEGSWRDQQRGVGEHRTYSRPW